MHFFQLLIYRLNSRVKSKLNKNVIHDFEFVRLLKRLNFNFRLNKSEIKITHVENGRNLNFSLKRYTSDCLVFKQIIIEKEYDYIIQLAKKNNLHIDSMIDFGANIGLTSMFFKCYYPNCEINAYEINANTFKRALKNFNENALSISSHLEGVWSKDCTLNISNDFRDNEDWSNHLSEHSKGQEVVCRSIINIIGSKKVDFVKIDIEGAEFELFRSPEFVKEWLPNIQIIAIEIHPEVEDPNLIVGYLQEHHFQLFLSGELLIGINKQYHKKGE